MKRKSVMNECTCVCLCIDEERIGMKRKKKIDHFTDFFSRGGGGGGGGMPTGGPSGGMQGGNSGECRVTVCSAWLLCRLQTMSDYQVNISVGCSSDYGLVGEMSGYQVNISVDCSSDYGQVGEMSDYRVSNVFA